MGQYHIVVNLDKKEFLHPHKLGSGLKLGEFLYDDGGPMSALGILLAASVKGGPRGGGDIHYEGTLQHRIGSWAGDRIAIIGDYAEDTDLPKKYHASTLWDDCLGDNAFYTDISADLRAIMEQSAGYRYTGSGWMDRTNVFDDSKRGPRLVPDMVVSLR